MVLLPVGAAKEGCLHEFVVWVTFCVLFVGAVVVPLWRGRPPVTCSVVFSLRFASMFSVWFTGVLVHYRNSLPIGESCLQKLPQCCPNMAIVLGSDSASNRPRV